MNIPSQKRQNALQLLAKTGMSASDYAPLGVQLLWRLGIDCPPPHLVGFGPAALACGLYFGVFMGLTMWAFAALSGESAYPAVPIGAALAGLLFGLMMAARFAHDRRKHQLPLWKDI